MNDASYHPTTSSDALTELSETAHDTGDRPVQRADEPEALDIVEEWGRESFPASDPPANW